MYKSFLLLPCFFLICTTGFTHSTITINPAQDNTLYESSSGSLSNGSGPGLFSGTTYNNEIRRAVIQFDIAGSLPSNAIITDVSLILTVDQTISGSANTSVHFLNAGWGEGLSYGSGAGATAQSNDATWLHRFYPGTFWNIPGGDYISSPSATLSVNGTGTYSWSSSQLISDVQAWVNNPLLNAGWIIVGDETNYPTTKRFASSEHSNAAARPKLVVSYYTGCHNAGVPSLSSPATAICPLSPASITVTGNLNSAQTWKLYTNNCGSVCIDSNVTGNFTVYPETSTAYFVRGEGGCVTPGQCGSITIDVLNADDPSFYYDSQGYCKSETNPSAIISGTGGGTFSSEPGGLFIDSSTGEIDLAVSTPGNYVVTYITNGPDCIDSSTVDISVFPEYATFQSATICNGEEFHFGSQVLSDDGIYTGHFNTMNGCDSVVTLELTVIFINVSVSQTENTLVALASGLNYQWLDCTDYSAIDGATSQNFEGDMHGIYSVIITDDNCADTSLCYSITGISSTGNSGALTIFPNPGNGIFYIFLPVINDPLIEVYNMAGQRIFCSIRRSNDLIEIYFETKEEAVYLVKISEGEKSFTGKIYLNK